MSFHTASKRILSLGIQPGLFFVAAVIASWPLSANIWSAIPSGDSPVGTVPMLNNWILWWNTEFLFHPGSYWDAPAFYPTKGAMALSEPQPILILLAPIAWLSGSTVFTYNIYLLLNLTLNGVAGAYLLATLGGSRPFQLIAGLLVTIHPLVWHNLEAIQLTVLAPFLFAFAFAVRAMTDYQDGDLSRIVLALATGSLACLHHTLLALLVLASTTPPCLAFAPGLLSELVNRWRQAPVWPRITRTAGVSIYLLALFFIYIEPMRTTLERATPIRSISTTQALSADTADWFSFPGYGLSMLMSIEADIPLNPGALRSTLAMIVILCCLKYAPVRIIGCALIISAILSFGSNLEFVGVKVWETACNTIYGLSFVRSPYRFAYFSQAFTIILATYALHMLSISMRDRSLGLRLVLQALLTTLVLADGVPARPLVCFLPLRQHQPEWSVELQKIPPHTSVLCLPPASSGSELASEQDAVWMSYATLHQQPILNGYSRFTPAVWQQLRRELNNPATRVQAIIDCPAEVIVIDLRLLPDFKASERLLPEFETIFDGDDILMLGRSENLR